MASEPPLLSVVCPAFDEEEVLPRFHAELNLALQPLAGRYRIEIIYVDDGSRDGTLGVLRQTSAADNRVRYLSLSRNFGHQAALTAGLEHARGDAVVTLDSDGQHPPSLIPTLVERWRTGADVVVAVRGGDRRLGPFKRLTSALFYRLLRRFSDLDVRDGVADFRLLSRRATDALIRLRESHRYLRGMIQWLGFAVDEVPYAPEARGAGASKYTLRKMLRLAGDGLFSFSRAPLRLSVLAGLTVTAASLLAAVAVALLRGSLSDPVLLTLLVGMHVVVGSLFAAIGVLGEYVARVHEEAKDRPIYVLKEVSPASGLSAPAVSSPHGNSRAA
jgi:dolichol-phosphate mannosyltransferase